MPTVQETRRATRPVPFHAVLQAGLALRGLDMRKVRARSGLSTGYFSRILRGRLQPGPETRRDLLRQIGCPESVAQALAAGRAAPRHSRELWAWILGETGAAC